MRHHHNRAILLVTQGAQQGANFVIGKFDGGPVGIETIAVAINEEVDTITDVYESFLMQIGFLSRTPRGRVATKLAYRYFNLSPPDELKQEELFNE